MGNVVKNNNIVTKISEAEKLYNSLTYFSYMENMIWRYLEYDRLLESKSFTPIYYDLYSYGESLVKEENQDEGLPNIFSLYLNMLEYCQHFTLTYDFNNSIRIVVFIIKQLSMIQKQDNEYCSKVSLDFITKMYRQAVRVIDISILNITEKSLMLRSIYDTLDNDVDKKALLYSIRTICPDCVNIIEILECTPFTSNDQYIMYKNSLRSPSNN